MKILIIRLSSLGDVLLTTPVVRCLKQQVKDAEIHFLTKDNAMTILVDNKNIDRLWTVDVNSTENTKQVINALINEKFDYVVDLHNNWRSRRFRRAMHCKTLVYKKENFHKFLFILTKHNFMSGRHVVDRYMDAVKPLGVKNDNKGMDLFIPEDLQGEALLEQRAGKKRVGDLIDKPYAVVAFGAQHITKSIPPDKLRMLCYSIELPVLILGDAKDHNILSKWGLHFDHHVTELCGKTSLMLSAAIISHAEVVVSADSAMMHFAAALHKPVIAIFGATDPALGFTPYCTKHVNCVVEDLRCHPCSRQGGEKCPRKHYKCMHQQEWQKIAKAAKLICEV